ncbi:regulator of RNase E activity RraA [Enterovirga rhinocerotis]|uniref:Putative 4-hydroxy-4-methyl-2-oxoglutarate aldolase n=2 Tax=Enterovirga rhinocerotis TaxID=1339210 RepID=A0A4R7BX40_9HYPH|nr:regulator of RNase E activity RraA [Enterovirga rhinocerotis]
MGEAEPADLLARCALIATSTWSDALDEAGLDGLVEGLPRRSGQGRFAAFASTAKLSVAPRGTYPKGQLGVGEIIEAVGAGGVLLVEMGGAVVSTFGGLAARAAAAKNVAAVVIDGACRDLDEIVDSGLWLASRHVTPRTGKTRGRLDAIGEPVVIGSVTIAAGDLVVGDDTGLVAIPRDRLRDILAIAEAKRATDDAVEAGLRAGLTFAEAARRAAYL